MDKPALAPLPSLLYGVDSFSEDEVVRAISELGVGAFEDEEVANEERLYPVPELARAGMFGAMEAAIDAGFQAWARDGSFLSAADILAGMGLDARLADFLGAHPPQASNPWAGKSIDKLWSSCLKRRLPRALDALARIGPAPLSAWTAASEADANGAAFSSLLASSPRCEQLDPDTLQTALGCLAGRRALSEIRTRPDFAPSRFRSPWPAAASLLRPEVLASMAEAGVPASGWGCRPERLDADAYAELALAKKGAGSASECSRQLFAAGLGSPSAASLRSAIEQGNLDLADVFETLGASPDKSCLSLCIRSAGGAAPYEELLDRAGRWLAAGLFDVLAPDAKRGGFAGPALKALMASVTNGAQGERPARARRLALSLAGSALWNASDEQALQRMVHADRQSFPSALRQAARALGAPEQLAATCRGALSWIERGSLSPGPAVGEAPATRRARL